MSNKKFSLKNYKNSVLFLIINIILAVPHAFTSLLVDTGMMKGTSSTENAYMSAVLIVWLIYSWFYANIKGFIRYLCNRRGNVTETFDKVVCWIYCIVSVGILFLINRIRELGVIGDSVCVIVAIFDIIFVNVKTKYINEDVLWDRLLSQEKNTYDSELMKKERKKQIKAAGVGALFGILSIVVLLIVRYPVFNLVTEFMGDPEFGVFAGIILGIILTILYAKLFNKINCSLLLKNMDKKVKTYWVIVDIVKNSFKVFSIISCMITLVVFLKFNMLLSLFIVLVMKWLNGYNIEQGWDPDYKFVDTGYSGYSYSSSSYSSSSYDKPKEKEEEKKPLFDIKTEYKKDSKGNYTIKETTYSYNDKYINMESKETSNLNGNVYRKEDTYKW